MQLLLDVAQRVSVNNESVEIGRRSLAASIARQGRLSLLDEQMSAFSKIATSS